MITGKQIREARIKKGVRAEVLAKAAGININTLYTWETADDLSNKNKTALGKVLRHLGFSLEETLKASNHVVKSKKGATSKKMKATRPVTVPKGAVQVVIGQGGGGGSGLSEQGRAADTAELIQMMGFFMGDPARRSNLARLLKAASRVGLTLYGLERAIDGNG